MSRIEQSLEKFFKIQGEDLKKIYSSENEKTIIDACMLVVTNVVATKVVEKSKTSQPFVFTDEDGVAALLECEQILNRAYEKVKKRRLETGVQSNSVGSSPNESTVPACALQNEKSEKELSDAIASNIKNKQAAAVPSAEKNNQTQ